MLSSDRNCLRKGSLMSRPRVTPEVARRARPGEARSRDCCRIIGVGVPRTEGWDPGSRGGALGAWSRRKGCGFTHAAVGFCVDSEEELRATARRVYLVERGLGWESGVAAIATSYDLGASRRSTWFPRSVAARDYRFRRIRRQNLGIKSLEEEQLTGTSGVREAASRRALWDLWFLRWIVLRRSLCLWVRGLNPRPSH